MISDDQYNLVYLLVLSVTHRHRIVNAYVSSKVVLVIQQLESHMITLMFADLPPSCDGRSHSFLLAHSTLV